MSFHRRRCAANGCTSTSLTHHFFRFPKNRTPSERLRYAKWAEFAQNRKVTGVKNSHAYLCALHFARNQFRDDDQDKLIYRAIPTIPARSDVPVFSMYQSTHSSVQSAECTEYMYIHSSEEDEDLVPHVQVLYPHDNPLEQSLESCALDSRVSTSMEPCEEGIVDQSYNSDNFLRVKKFFNEASSVSNAHDDCEENGELNLHGNMSHKMATPGRKRQIKHLLAKQLSPRVFRNKFGVQRKNLNNLLGLNSDSDSLVQQLEKMVPVVTAQFLASQLLHGRKQGRSREWTAAEKVLSAVVYKRWPECHRLLVKMLVLPGRKTLLKMMAKVSLQPGLNYNVFQPIAEAVVHMDAVDRTCLLLFGEVPVRGHLEYDNEIDAIAGFQNLGDNVESPKVGNRALVFMVKGLGKQWKQPVAFYFTRGTLDSESSVKLMCSVLQACKKAGLNVVGTVCRAGSGNTRLLKLVGASESRPYFHFEKQKVVTLYDVPHLLRYLRNILLKHDILVKHDLCGETVESKASWSFVRAAYDIDVQQPEQRHLPKLTDCHIAPKGHVTADTVVAAQVLSRTMAATIYNQVTNGLLDSSALATAHFVCFCDKLFDSLNGSAAEPEGADGIRCQLQKGREGVHLNFWNECLTEVKQWKVEVNSSVEGSECVGYFPLPCQSAWITTLEGMKLLWGALKGLGFKCVEPGSISLDTLNDLFRSVKSTCVPGMKITTRQFVSTVKTSLLDSLAFVDVEEINCTEKSDVDDQSSNIQGLVSCCSSALHRERIFKTTSFSLDGSGVFCLSCIVCGVARHLLLNSDCDSCELALCNSSRDPRLHCGIVFKDYVDTEDGLTYPSTELVGCLASAADVSMQVLPQIAYRERVQATLLMEMKETVNFEWLQFACPEHAESVSDEILTLMCRIMIPQWCKEKNEELSNVTKVCWQN